LAEDLAEHRHHLLRTNCGKTNDITPSAAISGTIWPWFEERPISSKGQ
jgi:hypothetical protein